jgi:hypothetical protein
MTTLPANTPDTGVATALLEPEIYYGPRQHARHGRGYSFTGTGDILRSPPARPTRAWLQLCWNRRYTTLPASTPGTGVATALLEPEIYYGPRQHARHGRGYNFTGTGDISPRRRRRAERKNQLVRDRIVQLAFGDFPGFSSVPVLRGLNCFLVYPSRPDLRCSPRPQVLAWPRVCDEDSPPHGC